MLILLMIFLAVSCAERNGMRNQESAVQPGAEAAKQEILVKFKPDTPDSQVTALQQEAGLELAKEIPQLNIRVFKITSQKSVEQVVALCEKKAYVQYAEPNQRYETQPKNQK